MAENKSDLQGLLGGILSNPDALQKMLSVVSGLKESGALESLLPLLRGSITESENENGDSGEKKERLSENDAEGQNEEGSGKAADGSSALPLLASLLSDKRNDGGAASDKAQKEEHSKQNEKNGEKESDKEHTGNRYHDHRRLLQALRPYLGAQRQERIDFILKLLQYMELAGKIGLKDLFTSKNQ